MATYTAWDGNEYPMPTPEGWYLGTDDRWWPEGHGPGPATQAVPSALAGPPGTGLPSAAPPVDNVPDWASAAETTIYSSPPPSSNVADAMASPVSSGGANGGGGNGKAFAVIGAVLVGLLAMGGLAFVLLGSSDETETVSTTTLPPAEDDVEPPVTVEPGDEPDPAVSVAPGRGSIDDPFAIGEPIVVEYSDNATGELRRWTIEVLGAASDITDAVLAENQFNEGPEGDQRFIGAPIRVTYVSGPAPASLFELTFKAVGPSAVVLTTFDPSCGVVPDALDTFAEVFEGGAVEGNICWSASPEDAADLTMLVEVFLDDTEIYAELSG